MSRIRSSVDLWVFCESSNSHADLLWWVCWVFSVGSRRGPCTAQTSSMRLVRYTTVALVITLCEEKGRVCVEWMRHVEKLRMKGSEGCCHDWCPVGGGWPWQRGQLSYNPPNRHTGGVLPGRACRRVCLCNECLQTLSVKSRPWIRGGRYEQISFQDMWGFILGYKLQYCRLLLKIRT